MSHCTTPIATDAASRVAEQCATRGPWTIAPISGMANPRPHVDFAKTARRPQEASP